MPAAASVEERLFSLVLALMATEQGLTKTQILSTVQGYSARYADAGATGALERQFERDKDELRELGIPLETIESPDAPGDNTALRYRIPKGRYDLPADIRFTPQEYALLTLAATVWKEGSLSAESRRALLKLRSLGIDPVDPIVGYAPRIRSSEPAFAPLNRAIGEAVVTFPYLKPGSSLPRLRTVFPLAFVQRDGRWLVFGHDLGMHATRTFLLSRIVGPVTRTDAAVPDVGFDIATAADRASAELDALAAANVAEVEVQPGTDAALRLGHRAAALEDDVLRLSYTDLELLADELAGFGPEVRVLAPEALRDAVRDRLRRVAELHEEDGRG